MRLSLYRRRAPGAFTLIELMLVMVVIAIMVVIATPSFAKLSKRTKVEQAANSVMGALWEARSLAQRNRITVAVLFGPDRSIPPAPVETAEYRLPEKNAIEIWQMRDRGSEPYAPEYPGGGPPDWYPYRFPMRKLTPIPITLPEGVRVITGRMGDNSGWYIYAADGSDEFKKSAVGVWKRHAAVFVRSGAMSWYSHRQVLIYEEASGDHLMITIGNNYNGTQRPRIDRNRIRKVAGNKLADPRLLHQEINAWGGDR